MLFKSQTQKILLYAIDSASGLGKSGLTDLVCSVSKDGGTNASATNTAAAVGNGLYSLELTAAETGAALVGVSATSATASVVVNPLIVFTTDGAVPPQEAGTSGGLGTVDASNRIAGIQGTINDLDGLPTAATIADQVWDEATSGHTSAGSYGKAVGDGVTTWVTATGFNTTTPPTVEAIADQVWDEAQSGHTTSGTFGYYLDAQVSSAASPPTAAAIADAVWDEATSGHTSAGSYGKAVGDGVTTWVTATGFNTTTPPTVEAIADQVWDEATSGHTSAGSYGKAIGDGVTSWVTATGFNTTTPPTVEAIADQVWDEATSGHTTAGSYGKAIGDGVTTWVTATGFSTFDSSADAVTVGTVSSTPINAIADGLLDRADGVEPASAGTERTVREALRLILSACAGQVAGASGTTITIRDTNDTTNRITATVDSDGNRTAVTYIDS